MNAPEHSFAGRLSSGSCRFAKLVSFLSVISVLSVVNSFPAQQAWVANYNNGPGSTNRAMGIAVDPSGNILVAGTSTGSATGYDYIVIKYSPSGSIAWSRRFASPGAAYDEPRGFAVDMAGNSFLTGSSQTVKYDASGTLMWSHPFAGRALAIDGQYVYVTGFSNTHYATVKIDAVNGSNVWMRV